MVFAVLKIIYPPLASWFHTMVKKRNYRRLQNILIDAFDEDFWSNCVSN